MNSVAPANNGAPGSRQTLNNTVQIHGANQAPPIAPPPSYGVATQQYGVQYGTQQYGAQYGAQYGTQAPITTQPMAQPPPGGQVPYGTQGQAQYGTQEFELTQAQYGGAIAVMAPGTVLAPPEVRWLQVEQVPGCHPCISPLVALNSVIMQDESGLLIPAGNISMQNKIFKILTPDGFVIYAGTSEYSMSSFKCSMTDQGGQEAIRMNAAFECCGGFCRCCKSDINIEAPPGNSLGQMKQVCQLLGLAFSLELHDCPAIEFSTYTVGFTATVKIMQGGQAIGNIVGPAESPPSPNGFLGAMCVQINFFGEVDVKVKAGIIGAASFLSWRIFVVSRRGRGAHRRRHGHAHRRRRRRRR